MQLISQQTTNVQASSLGLCFPRFFALSVLVRRLCIRPRSIGHMQQPPRHDASAQGHCLIASLPRLRRRRTHRWMPRNTGWEPPGKKGSKILASTRRSARTLWCSLLGTQRRSGPVARQSRSCSYWSGAVILVVSTNIDPCAALASHKPQSVRARPFWPASRAAVVCHPDHRARSHKWVV